MHNSITRNKVLLWTAAGLGMAAASFFVLTIRGDFPQLRARLAKVPILQSLISQRDQISAYSKLSTLDYSIPIFDALIETLEKPGTFNARRLRGYNGYIDYYEKVVELFPAMAEGYGLLGFLYHQEGDIAKAILAYQKAAELRPDFFWFHYNLAILYCKNRQYQAAETEVQRAQAFSPENSLRIIHNAKIYQQIIRQENFHYDWEASLRQAYKDMPALLQLCVYAAKSAPSQMNMIFDKLLLKIF